ncbi:hypothetical protein KUCAC02_028363 [Scomber scombrus]|uniref:HAT C-terminal dimerisation domain-containing protein n=1 Tax=Scomber scombrus TaxID=13677 RepID=A0AAV1Q7E1_SCOSC
MAQFYGVTEENLTAELHQVQRLLERKKAQGHVVNDTLEFLALMRPYRDAFVDLYRLICISLTLPVISASSERSFSCLRRIKNYLRNSSGDTRNSNLALLSINKERTKTLDVQRIIDSSSLPPITKNSGLYSFENLNLASTRSGKKREEFMDAYTCLCNFISSRNIAWRKGNDMDCKSDD